MLQVVTERAAAVIGNLSTSRDYFSSIRESGALQRLVALLDAGSTSRVTEIAAKTLANLSIDDNSRKGIRLAGGVPPLMRLLLEKPSEQVSNPLLNAWFPLWLGSYCFQSTWLSPCFCHLVFMFSSR